MLSFLKLSVAGSLFLLATLLHRCGVQSASMRQHKTWGGETDARQPGPYFLPSADMVKALEYIERLRQQSDQATEESDPDYDGDTDRFRSQLRIGPVQTQEEPDRDLAVGWQDIKSEQRLKTLLKTLKQASREPKAATVPLSSRVTYGNRQQADDREDYSQTGRAGDYGGYPFRERSKPHKKYPLMLEYENSRESPYKRTNENVEEQYTPQSLATLQSVFEELGKLSAIKGHKRQSLDDDQFYRGDDDDIYRVNNLAYEDVAGGEEWTPVEEKVETEEVVKDSREEFDRDADENDDDDDDDEDDDEDDTIKRSSQPARYREQEDPDYFTKLVDYYLLKILERSEQTEQKRDRAEEQDTAKRLARASYDLDPQAIYQLIEISDKLQIPPEDLIEMLKSGEIKKQDKMLEPEEETDEIDRVEEKLFQISTHNKDKSPTTKLSNRRLPEMLESDIPDDLNTDDILSILGLESMGNQKAKYFQKQRKPKNTQAGYYAPSGRRGNYILSDPSVSDKREADYDDTVAEDEVATYLAAKMLAQYPKVINKMDKRASQPSPKDEQLAFGTFEQAMLNYFDQLAAEKSSPVKRLPESDDNGDSPQSQRLDDETLLKMLEYLNPETNGNEERAPYGKPIGGM